MDIQLQNQEHRTWLSQLNFYQDEIKIFQNELLRVIHKHPDYLFILEHVEEYRAIFIRKLQHVDDLRHKLLLAQKMREGKDASEEYEALKSDIENFVAAFEQLKVNFRRFVSHND